MTIIHIIALFIVAYFVLKVIIFYYNTILENSKLNLPPTPSNWFFLGHFVYITRRSLFGKKTFHEINDQLSSQYGPIVHMQLLSWHVFLVSDPKLITKICNDPNYNVLIEALHMMQHEIIRGVSIFSSKGEDWKFRRGMSTPWFSLKNMPKLAPNLTKRMGEVVEYIKQQNSEPIEASSFMKSIALELFMRGYLPYVILLTQLTEAFEIKLDALQSNSQVFVAMDAIIKYFGELVMHPFPSVWKMMHPFKFLAIRKQQDILDKFLLEQILQRKNKILKEHQEGEEEIVFDTYCKNFVNETDILNELKELMVAAYDTPGPTINWILWNLTQYPEVQRKCQQEVDELLQGQPPTWSDLPKLRYLEATFKESQRFTPFSTGIIRSCLNGDKIDGYDIPPNSGFILNTYHYYRNEKYFKDPLEFRPERWLTTESTRQLFGFGEGFRSCLGEKYAKLHIRMMFAMLMQNFDIEIDHSKPWPCIQTTGYSHIDLYIKFKPRLM